MLLHVKSLYNDSKQNKKEIFAEIENNEVKNIIHGNFHSVKVNTISNYSLHTHPDNSPPSVQDYLTLFYHCVKQEKILKHFVITETCIYFLEIQNKTLREFQEILKTFTHEKIKVFMNRFIKNTQDLIQANNIAYVYYDKM